MSRVAIIGVDGGTWRILQPLLDRGLMPNLGRLVDEGMSTILRSTMPPITPAAWTTFQTGVNPGVHGVLDFNQWVPGTYDTAFVNSGVISSPTIWTLAGRAGKRVIALNVPVTYPPYPVNGVIVSGMETPGLDSAFTYPPSAGASLLSSVPDYTIMTTSAAYNLRGLDYFIDQLVRTIDARARAMEFLMRSNPWDLAMVHFQSPDVLQHSLYPHLDPACPGHDPAIYERAIRVYEALDRSIGRLTPHFAGPDTWTMVISDHGFRPSHTTVFINEWLCREGFIGLRQSSLPSRAVRSIVRAVLALDRFDLARAIIKRQARGQVRKRLTTDAFVSWPSTKVYAYGWWGAFLYPNVAGREPHGCVRTEELPALFEEVTESLARLRGPAGEPITKTVHSREDLFSGPFSHHCPEMLVEPVEGFFFNSAMSGRLFRRNIPRRDHLGTHDMDGILVMSGPGVKRRAAVSHAEMVDMPFTVMHLLGLPVPAHFEGEFIESAFDADWLSINTVRRRDYPFELPSDSGRGAYTDEDEERIRGRLSDLGYL